MTQATVRQFCKNCGLEIHQVERLPCACGSSARHIDVSYAETLTVEDHLKGSLKGPKSGGRRLYEIIFGDEFSHRLQRWVHKFREIHRAKNFYHEEVTDPQTGERIHYCKEPLDKHIGHGSDKFSK